MNTSNPSGFFGSYYKKDTNPLYNPSEQPPFDKFSPVGGFTPPTGFGSSTYNPSGFAGFGSNSGNGFASFGGLGVGSNGYMSQSYNSNGFSDNMYNTYYSTGYNTGYDKGFNAGYHKATVDIESRRYYLNQQIPSVQSYPSMTEFATGYNSGIKSYIDAVNLVNSHSPVKNTPEKKPYKHKQYKKKQSTPKLAPTPKPETPKLDELKPTLEEKKPILIIKKLTRDTQTDSCDFGSMFTNLGKCDDTEKVNYLEDSDDDCDDLVTLDDLICTDESIIEKKNTFDEMKIVSFNDIIGKNNIASIDDLITIGTYYETNFMKKETVDTAETSEEPVVEPEEHTELSEEEYLNIMRTILRSIGTPLNQQQILLLITIVKRKFYLPHKLQQIKKIKMKNLNCIKYKIVILQLI